MLPARAGAIPGLAQVLIVIWRGATPWPGLAASPGVDRGYCRRDP
jgi:hypothetical protein